MMLLLLAAVSLADIPPPAGYVETCTLEIQCGDIAGKTCAGWHGGREECEALETEGMVRMCSTAGASAWTEVFCETQPAAADVEARVKKAKGLASRAQRACACVTGPVGAAGPILALVALLGIRRRSGGVA